MSDFWSRRKQAVEEAEAAVRATEVEAEEAKSQAETEAAQAEMTEEELLDSLGLPDPDVAKSGDDIAASIISAAASNIIRIQKIMNATPFNMR